MSDVLPPGQYEIQELPRFGLAKFAKRFPKDAKDLSIQVGGDCTGTLIQSEDLLQLPLASQVSDFHCVTTWSKRNVAWSGYRFSDFYRQLVVTRASAKDSASFVIFRCQDGFRAAMPLSDLMKDDVLLATELAGEPLSIANGAPVRLVAPSHYGYKSAKHLCAIEFWNDERHYRPPAFRFMDHSRARVEYEERGRVVPARLLRGLYRPLVAYTRRKFRDALDKHQSSDS